MKKAMSLIYNYRSKSLHGGTPFPAPMCTAPIVFEASSRPAEIPIGVTTRALGGTWQKKDVPMLLHTFELIARGTLRRWWESLTPPQY